MTNLITLPFEVLEQIFQYYFKVDGGYVFDGDSEKLRTADSNPIDLSLMYTCRSIANDTKHMPLNLNTIAFSTVYREDWRVLAGCFSYVSTFYSLLEADLVVRLARFMTPDMYSRLALKFPAFVSQIQDASMIQEGFVDDFQEMLDDEVEGNGSDVESISDDESERTMADKIGNIRQGYASGYAFRWKGKMLETKLPRYHYSGFGHIPRHPLQSVPYPGDWHGRFWAIQGAISCCLRLLAEKEPAEFTKLVYEALPGWTDTYPAHEFLDLAFEPWALPSQSEMATAISRLDADDVLRFLEPWYHSSSSYDPSVINDTSHKPTGTRCREKCRFSATAVAIRFLNHLPVYQRLRIRNVILYEDLPAVGNPSIHAQGLAPFFKENPRLRVERRVSLLRCMESSVSAPQYATYFLQHPSHEELENYNSNDIKDFSERLCEWLVDAMAVTDVGISAEAFTFILDAGPHADFCTDLFQQVVRQNIAWYKAYTECTDRGFLSGIRHERGDWPFPLVYESFEGIMELLRNQTSYLRSNFHVGYPLDFEKLVEQTKNLNTFLRWAYEWTCRRPTIELPPAIDRTNTLADYYEIQTKDEYL